MSSTPTITPPQKLDFGSIPGHQIHDPDTIGPPHKTTLGEVNQAADAMAGNNPIQRVENRIAAPIAYAVDKGENFIDQEKYKHPILQNAIELGFGGQAAGKPLGTESGVLNNPVTAAMSFADIAPGSLNFDDIPGHTTLEAPKSPHEPLPEDKYVYHAADKSRTGSIRQQGIKPRSWYANSPEEALRSGAVPISGNKADLRVFAVPKGDIEPATPDAADIGARESEKGRFVVSSKSHQPIEVDHEGRPFQNHRQIAEGQGLVYKGELTPGSGVHMIEHPNHPGMTAALTEPVTPDTVNAAMTRKLKEFGVSPTK